MGYSVIRIALLLAGVCLLVGAFLGWRWWESRRLSKISYQEYQIRREIQSGNYQEAQKLIKKVAEEESPYTPLVLSYQLYLEREGGLQVDEVKTLQSIISSLKDKDILSLYRERLAYAYFTAGNYQKALELLESIKGDSLNYYSAQILKGLVLEKVGRRDEAKAVYSQVEKMAKDTYFGNIASALLMEER